MKEYNRILVTAALPYANGPVHIGHLAGCYIPADIYVRYQRSRKRDVLFIGGSDEHGVPITIRAMKEGITPQQVVDKYHALIKKSFEQMFISFDIYSRTSNPVHHETDGSATGLGTYGIGITFGPAGVFSVVDRAWLAWPPGVHRRPPGARVMAAGAHRLSGRRLPPVQGPVASVAAESVGLRRNGRHGAGGAGPLLVPDSSGAGSVRGHLVRSVTSRSVMSRCLSSTGMKSLPRSGSWFSPRRCGGS